MLTPWSGTCSSNGALFTEKTLGSARSDLCCPSCSKGWSVRLSPSTLKVYVAAITANHDPVEGKSVGKHDWVIRFLRGAAKNKSFTPPSIPLLGPVSSAHSTTAGPVRAFADSRAKVPLNENSASACTGLHKRVGDPTRIFGWRFVLTVWTGGFPDNPEGPARLCAQGSHYSFQRPGGELAKRCPRRRQTQPLLCFVPSELLRWQYAKLQDLRPALCLSRRPGRKGMPSPSRGWPTG